MGYKPRSNCEEKDCVSLQQGGHELALMYETVETSDLHEVIGTSDIKLVLLPFFDGIGAAHDALANLGVKPSFAMSFENDEECKSVLCARFPDVEIIGSYDLYTAEESWSALRKQRPRATTSWPSSPRAPMPGHQPDQGQHLQGPHRPRRQEVRQVHRTPAQPPRCN